MIELMGWLGTCTSVTGAFLAARKNKWCWIWYLTSNVFWAIFAAGIHSWSLTVSNLIFAAINIYGLRNWTR